MKVLFYVIAALGILALIAGVALKVLHHAHGTEALGVGALLVIVGIACVFLVKPKAATTA